jgi:hypothetical protein
MRLPTADELLTSITVGLESLKRNNNRFEGEWSEYHEMLEKIDNQIWELTTQIAGIHPND